MEPLPYHEFRLGLSFRDVREMLWIERREAREQGGARRWVTRSTVLGRMRELKLSMYRQYLQEIAELNDEYAKYDIDCTG
jgi:hypothetical protein